MMNTDLAWLCLERELESIAALIPEGANIVCDCAIGKTCKLCEDGKAAGIIDQHNRLI